MPDTTKPVRLLLVEDDADTRENICAAARRYQVDCAGTVADARRALAARSYDLLVVDLGLPDGDGLTVADALRAAGSEIPILVLTGQAELARRLDGFSRGADDYLCKPFYPDELVARLHALLRRARPERRDLLRYNGLELDLIQREARYQELRAELSERETALLAYFMRHAEQVVTRAALLEEVWGEEAEGESSVLNVYVNYLRNKLERGRWPRLIHTVRGVGYVLSETPP